VTSIGEQAFVSCLGLTAVTIPSSVTSIGEWAFDGCNGLTAITIPEGVTSIGDWAFASCSGLTAVTIPSSVTSIGSSAFQGCSSLTAVTLPNSLTSIEDNAFYDCTGLKDVTVEWATPLPVEAYLFGSVDLSEVILHVPAGTKDLYKDAAVWGEFGTIAERIFSGTTGNCTWTITGHFNDYTLTISGNGTMGNYTGNNPAPWYAYREGIRTLILEPGVTGVGDYAFSRCVGLTSVTIPNSVTGIEWAAFAYCSGLKDVSVEWAKPLSVEAAVFISVNLSGATLHVPAGKDDLYADAAVWKDFGTIAERFIGGTTGDCKWTITGYAGDYTLTVSGNGAMPDYTSDNPVPWASYREDIKTVVLEQGVTGIGKNAFADLHNLTSVAIPGSVTGIGAFAFSNCSRLKGVTIPGSVTSIGEGSFGYCSNLSFMTVETGNAFFVSVDSVLFNKNKTALIQYPAGKYGSYYEIPGSVTGIEGYAFAACRSLDSVIIPGSVTDIGESAFVDCSGLKNVTVGWEIPLYIPDHSFVNIFQGVPLTEAILHVPAGRKTSYAVAMVWENFGMIVENVTVRPEPSLSVTPLSFNLASDADTIQLTVKANVNWTAVSSADWLELEDRNRDGVINASDLSANNVLTVRTMFHTGTTFRNAGIIFSAGDLRQTVVVTQAAPVLPSSVTLDGTMLSLGVHKTVQLGATVLPAIAYDRRVTWSSDNPQVATVSSDGLVRGLAEGKAVITVRTVAGNLTASCTVTVEEQTLVAEPDLPSGSQGNIEVSLKIPVDESFSITFTLTLPAGFTLNQSATSLTDELKSLYLLFFRSDGQGGWLFEIIPNVSTRSLDNMTYQKVVNILYTLEEDVRVGNHPVKIKGAEMTLLSSDTTIRQDEINIPVTVLPNATGTDVIGGSSSSSVWYHGGFLHVDTPQDEGITVYSMTGRMLHRAQKAEGAAVFNLNGLPRGILIVRGDSGWTRKIVR
jgi:uncharacterized protein YjdB